MPGGRPTSYREEYCQSIIDHFSMEPEDFTSGMKNFPTFEGFANSIDSSMGRMHEWKEKHEEFRNAYKKANELREQLFTQIGLKKGFDTTFAIFYAKNCLGWKDKTETHNTHELGGAINITIVKGNKE